MSDTDTRDREDNRYPQIMRMVRETAWAVLPSTLATILDVVQTRAAGARFTAEEIQARVGGREARRDVQVAGSVAILPVYGVIVPKADMFTEISGATSVQQLQESFRAALEDEAVSAIVLDVDSPGGSADMLTEFASVIREARGTKPVVAVANPRAASAAYWLASQADEVVVTKSGDVGSVGVFAAHEDISKMQEKLGVTTTLISAGRFKTEISPFKELSDEARATIQQRVDETYAMFVSDVAKGRRMSVDTVRSDFGEGRMLSASAAQKAGMVDRVDTLEATVQRLARARTRPAAAAAESQMPPPQATDTTELEAAESGLSFADTVDAALRAVETVVERAEALRALTGTKRAQLAALVERTTQLLATDEPRPEPSPTTSDLDLEAQFAVLMAGSRLRKAA